MPPRKHTGFTHDVATVGAAVLDEYVASDHTTIHHVAHAAVDRYACVPLGAKLRLSSFLTSPGGAAVNAAATCASLKLATAMIARVGTDLFGDFLLDQVRNRQIDIRHVQRDRQTPTGKSVVFTAPTGERTIFTFRGANARLDLAAIPQSRIRPRWFYVGSLSGQGRRLATLLDYAERIGSRVAWNPGMHDLASGLPLLMPLLRRLDVLLMNREEAAFLTHQPPRHLAQILKKLAPLPKLALLVSDGPKGAYLKSMEGCWFAPALRGKRVDTTGAGDALGSGFIAGYAHTCDLQTAFKIGMLNATGVVRRPGATEGILARWPAGTDLRKAVLHAIDL